jgi:acyl-CoA thioesterase FadM
VRTAIADAYRREQGDIGSNPEIWHATVSLSVDYLRPTHISDVIQLAARVVDADDRGMSVACVLSAGGTDRVRATVGVTRVPG